MPTGRMAPVATNASHETTRSNSKLRRFLISRAVWQIGDGQISRKAPPHTDAAQKQKIEGGGTHTREAPREDEEGSHQGHHSMRTADASPASREHHSLFENVVYLWLGVIAYLLTLLLKVLHWSTQVEKASRQPSTAPPTQPTDDTEIIRKVVEEIWLQPPLQSVPLYTQPERNVQLPHQVARKVQALRSAIQAEVTQWPSHTRAEAVAHLDDLTLARFLDSPVVSEGDVYTAFKDAMMWRAEQKLAALACEYHPANQHSASASVRQVFAREHFYAGFGGTCLDGTAFVVERVGVADHAGLTSHPALLSLATEAYLAHYELLFRCVRASSAATGRLTSSTIIVDARGAGLRMLRHMQLSAYIAKHGPGNFPGVASTVMIVNAPRAVAAIFAVIKPLLPAKTRHKVSIYGEGDATASALHKVIDPRALPYFLRVGRAEDQPEERQTMPRAKLVGAQVAQLVESGTIQ